MKRLNQSGQALPESLVVFPIGILVVSLLLFSFASAWSLFWIEFQLQESVVCLSDELPWKCRQEGLRKMRQGASYVEITSFKLEKKKDELYGALDFRFSIHRLLQFRLEKTVPWPIRF